MYILLAAATYREIQPTIDYLHQHNYQVGDHEIDVLITGIGIVSTTYLLTYNINNDRPDYLLQAGIGGSFSTACPPGNVVFINEEIIGDIGVEENNDFIDVFDMGLQELTTGPYTGKSLVNPYWPDWKDYELPFVKGITVNEITTRASRIEQLKQKYQPVIESMEGAALHYTCLMERLPFIQLRAVSNYVGERDKSKWKMTEAIGILNEKLVEILKGEW
jgi:futalosine hydrolase